MIHRASLLPLVAALALSAAVGCSTPKPEPEIASSASQQGYAVGFPQALTEATTSFSQGQSEIRKGIAELPGYPGKLKNPGWARVRDVMSRADQAGKSSAYVDRMRRIEGAYEFFATEKDEITRKVAGSAQFVAKKQCDVDVSGAVASSLKDTIDKQLEKELRDANESQHLIDRYRTALGKENAAALELQADALSRTSYLVHVQLVESKLRVQRMLTEIDEVQRTYDAALAAERELQAEKRTTAPEKKASDERIAEINKSRAALDSAVQQGSSLLPQLDEQIQTITREYDEALAKLLASLDEKAKSDPR
ncbi:MAG: hypothetical protein ACMG6S_16080 [Byssovorax sp.]